MRRQRRTLHVRAFTLVEMLIAIFIVSVGIIGVLALVTATLKSSGKIIEDSYASTVGRSVYEALRAGARQRSFIVPDPIQLTKVYRGFCFVHDGVTDPWAAASGGNPYAPPIIPTSQTTASDLAVFVPSLLQSDFAIFLPPGPPVGATTTNWFDPIFVYPRPSAQQLDGKILQTNTQNENVSATDNSFKSPHAGYDGKSVVYDVRRVYSLVNRPLPLGAPSPPPVTATTSLKQADASDQYGFAIAIRRALAPDLAPSPNPFAKIDGTLDRTVFPPAVQIDGAPTAYLHPVDGLYQVEVMVFRNFEPYYKASATTNPDPNEQKHTHDPVGSFVGLIAIGG